MKLRVLGNSLRLRLTRGEVAQIAAGQAVHERTSFGSGTDFVYSVSADPSAAQPQAQFSDGNLQVRLPAAQALQWAVSDEISLRGEQPAGDEVLRILVEKDFACLAPREGEDDSDAFPHPAA